jgi:uncharacterized protein (TIGR02246 family)
MKKINPFKVATLCVALACLTPGCNNAPEEKAAATTTTTETAPPAAVTTDMAKLKATIQALENSWAAADNARDTNAIAAFYADDAISLSNNKPMVKGKAAILNDIKEGLTKRPKGSVVSYDIMDVFGNEQTVTETGTSTQKDATGKILNTGKYMAIWENRNGKYNCVRDIYNDDVKQK